MSQILDEEQHLHLPNIAANYLSKDLSLLGYAAITG